MPAFLNVAFKIMAFAGALVLVWRVALLAWRVEYAESILSRTPEQRKRLMNYYRRQRGMIKLVLWLLPLVLVAVALLPYFVPESDGRMMLIVIVELMLLSGGEYFFDSWLVRYVIKHEGELPADLDPQTRSA